MAGSYLVKNTKWTRDFLRGFADYEFRLPESFHGTDNGAIHAYLAEIICHNDVVNLPFCLWIYNNSNGFNDLFLYEACIRHLLGEAPRFERIKILPKGTAWTRDNWITNSKWNDERDFMMHNWKTTQLRPLPYENLIFSGNSTNYAQSSTLHRLESESRGEWYNPIAGPIVLSLCTRGNTTWQYDRNLLATRQQIDDRLISLAETVDEERAEAMVHLQKLWKIWLTMNDRDNDNTKHGPCNSLEIL
ncbi:unnamed protein product [Haemonchus placei]|uniref:Exostosin domain-containing protein n=1 Tax=Haemonchus placei TaxID=6290 RepID=A0A0N4WM79_HAEPC|nr:unnamed protein product [Haemonchus placei]